MAIEAGKFFVNLGLVGAEKTLSGLSQVNDHFAGLKGISTEAKLAILAALAGLEQIVSVSGKFGNETMKTHQHLMVSIHDLQLYEAMAQRAGAATGSMTSAFNEIQNAMEALKLEGKAAPFMPVLMSLIQQGGYNMKASDIVKWGSEENGPVKFFDLLLNMMHNKKIKQADLNYMIQQSGLLPQDIYDVAKLGAFGPASRRIAEREIVPTDVITQLNQLNKAWKDFELESLKIMHLFATGLLPFVQQMDRGVTHIANIFQEIVGDRMQLEKAAASPSQNDSIFFKMHPELAALKGSPLHPTMGNITVNSNINISTPTSLLAENPSAAQFEKLKKTISQIWTDTISKTGSTRTGQ